MFPARSVLSTRRLPLLLFAAGVLAVSITGCKQAPGPDVLATVNGKSILQADVDRIYKQSVGDAAEQQSKEQVATARLNILHQMIVDEIMQQRAAKLNLVATDEEVDAKLTDMKALSAAGRVQPAAQAGKT